MSHKTQGPIPLTREEAKKLAELTQGDGWSIVKPEALRNAGINDTFVKACTAEHRSDMSDPKSTISRDGEVIDHLEGVYLLDALRLAAQLLDVKYERKHGRGFQARVLCEALTQAAREV